MIEKNGSILDGEVFGDDWRNSYGSRHTIVSTDLEWVYN